MIGSYIKYGGVTAKVRAMYGSRIRPEDYELLLSKTTIREVVETLRQFSAYSKVFSEIDERQLHRAQTENAIRTSLYDDFKKILAFFPSKQADFFSLYLARDELIKLVRISTRLSTKGFLNNEFLFRCCQPDFPDSDYLIKFEDIAQMKSLDDFLGFLVKTKYKDVISLFGDENKSPSELEYGLMVYFYSKLFELIDMTFSKKDRRVISELIGTRIDIKNIARILRIRKYFPKTDCRTLMLPYGKMLKKRKLEALITADDPVNEIKTICPSYYKYFENKDWISSVDFDALDDILFDIDKTILRTADPSASVPFAYLGLKAVEVNNLIHIIEGIRYGISRDEIVKRLQGVKPVNSYS